jgi:hypothetical protein
VTRFINGTDRKSKEIASFAVSFASNVSEAVELREHQPGGQPPGPPVCFSLISIQIPKQPQVKNLPVQVNTSVPSGNRKLLKRFPEGTVKTPIPERGAFWS